MFKKRSQSVFVAESVRKSLVDSEKATIALLGSASVGKTAIVHRFLYNKFIDEHIPTVENLYSISHKNLSLSLLDTTGTYQFPAMRELAIKKSDGFILVYDVDDLDSFENAKFCKNLIAELRPEEKNIPMVIVGNKCDFEKPRTVDRCMAESVVSIDWENCHFEASAKDNYNVVELFNNVMMQTKKTHSFAPLIERRLSLPTNSLMQKFSIQRRDSCSM